MSIDPDDDAVLACAVAAGAELIVSGDKHLRNLKSGNASLSGWSRRAWSISTAAGALPRSAHRPFGAYGLPPGMTVKRDLSGSR